MLFGDRSKKNKSIQSTASAVVAAEARADPPPHVSNNFKGLSAARVRQVHTLNRMANPESFIHRRAEKELIDAIDNPSCCVIALHGASKQGKTSILRSALTEQRPHLLVLPGAKVTREQLYRNILARSKARTNANEIYRIAAETGIKAVGVFTVSADEERQIDYVQGDCSDVNWVGEVLLQSTAARIIAIDNFHHVDEDVQSELATDFVVLATMGFKIVVAGTWKEHDYLVTRNIDLREYYAHIPIDPWAQDELEAVVLAGAAALGVELPKEVSRCLARDANGSVAALQQITQRYYLDVIEHNPRYEKANHQVQVNIAATTVSRERAQDLARLLVEVADWGAKDSSGRSQVSFIMEALIRAAPRELAAGFLEVELKERVDQCAIEWSRLSKHSAQTMSIQDFTKKLKVDWLAHQIQKNNTPIVVYDKTSKRVSINDAMLIFVHRTNRDLLVSEFRKILQRQLV